jgi:hypothetical protein
MTINDDHSLCCRRGLQPPLLITIRTEQVTIRTGQVEPIDSTNESQSIGRTRANRSETDESQSIRANERPWILGKRGPIIFSISSGRGSPADAPKTLHFIQSLLSKHHLQTTITSTNVVDMPPATNANSNYSDRDVT